MEILDPHFIKRPFNYIFQCTIAVLMMINILLFLDVLTHTALIASLGSSVFIACSLPKSYMARMRVMLGGYIVSMGVGLVCHHMLISGIGLPLLSGRIAFTIFAALSVGVSIFLMVITNSEHAPAAGIALGLVLNQWEVRNLLFMTGAVIFIVLIKEILRPYLIDLI
ncbi:MAG: HPP family protein [Elusimicrobia bacterium]|nr:HPP family protein [Elusimicrobiota bacterium]